VESLDLSHCSGADARGPPSLIQRPSFRLFRRQSNQCQRSIRTRSTFESTVRKKWNPCSRDRTSSWISVRRRSGQEVIGDLTHLAWEAQYSLDKLRTLVPDIEERNLGEFVLSLPGNGIASADSSNRDVAPIDYEAYSGIDGDSIVHSATGFSASIGQGSSMSVQHMPIGNRGPNSSTVAGTEMWAIGEKKILGQWVWVSYSAIHFGEEGGTVYENGEGVDPVTLTQPAWTLSMTVTR
jgi:hypothetical protein